jgi:hypothetical protein
MEKNGKMGGNNILGQRQSNYHDEKISFSKKLAIFFLKHRKFARKNSHFILFVAKM